MIDSEDVLFLIIKIFESGLDEDTAFYKNYDNINIVDLNSQLQKCKKGSLESILLSKLIKDINDKDPENNIFGCR